MSVDRAAVGKTYPPLSYVAGREKIREYASAVGETNPLYHDPEAARAAGYGDVVAPPMFAVVYAAPALSRALVDPEVGIDFAHLLHVRQAFAWGPLVQAGDEIATEVEVTSIEERGGMGFFAFETRSTNGQGERVCTGTWTNVVRGG